MGTRAGTLFITADETESVLTWPDMIGALRAAYAADLDEGASPPRVVARGSGAWLRALAAIPPSGRFMGSKVFGFSRSRKVSYLITLFDQETGDIVGLLDANAVTALRTAATSALAVDLIAPRQLRTVAVLGSGSEAQSHIRAVAAVRTFDEVRVFSPTAANRDAFASAFETETGISCRPVSSPRDAVEGADLVIAAARSHDETPILHGDWLVPGMTIVSIGSTLPDQHEIDARTVEVCDLIVCDMPEEVALETGDMIAARAAGVNFEDKTISLNDLVCGRCDDRVEAAGLPMFKSVGAAVQDITVAELAYERAIERNLGTRLPIAFRDKRG